MTNGKTEEPVKKLTAREKTKHGIILIVLFLSLIFGGFYGLTQLGLDAALSSVISIIAAAFSLYLLLGTSGIISEFTIKGASFDISAKFTEEIQNVKLDLSDTRREISEKVADIRLAVQNQNIIDNSKTYNYGKAEGEATPLYTTGNIKPQRFNPDEKKSYLDEQKAKKLDSLIRKMETLEEISEKQIEPNIGELIRRTNFYIHEKSFERALDYSNKILDKDKFNTEALFNKAYSLAKLKDYEEAINSYKEIRDFKNDPDVTNNLGAAYAQMKKYEEALKWYDMALEIDPKCVYAMNGKGSALGGLKKYEEALKWYDMALEIDPKDVSAMNGKGSALGDLKKYEEALKWYDMALEIDPKYVSAMYGKGSALGDLKKYEEALKWYDMALEIDPKYVYAMNGKGSALGGLKKYEEALKWYDMALEIDPKDVSAMNGKGNALGDLKKYEEALKWYDMALEIDPKDVYAIYNKSCIFSKIGKIDKSLNCLQESISMDPAIKEWAKDDPYFDSLRNNERFKKMLE